MQNNQSKYNLERLLIYIKGFFPSLFSFFIKKKNRIILNSTRNTYYNFNSKYLFEYLVDNHPEVEVRFVINDKQKMVLMKKKYPQYAPYFIETESLKGMWYALQASCWVCSALETPVGGFFHKYNRMVYHVGHGAYFRSAMFLENALPLLKRVYYHLIKYNFSYHLVTSEAIADKSAIMFGCRKDQLVILGEPMNDLIFQPNVTLLESHFRAEDISENRNILYMPTWRQEGGVKLFPFEDRNLDKLVNFLEEEHINIFLRMHPSYEEDLSFYTNKSSRFKILDTSIVEDVNEVAGFFDLVITDYSSAHIGFLLTEKPVLFLPYDLEKYEKRMGFLFSYEDATPGPKPKSQEEFVFEIKRLLNDASYFLQERKRVSKLFNKYKKNNSEMNVGFIMSKMS